MDFTESTVVARAPHALSSEVDGETVIMMFSSGSYFRLNGMGTRIWRMIDAPTDLGAIESALLVEYEIEPSTCRKEISAFIGHLIENSIVVVRG